MPALPKFSAHQIIQRVGKYAGELTGTKAKRAKEISSLVNTLYEEKKALKRVGKATVDSVKRRANAESQRSFNTRVKTGIGLAAIGGAGFLGLHKYHQHVDNKILDRIDSMGYKQYTE